MKTLWGLLIVISFASLLFGGVFTSLQEIETNNPSLTTDSLNLIDKYEIEYDNPQNKSLTDFNTLGQPSTNFSNNNTNEVDSFFREYAEAKDNINKFASAINFLYHIPSLMLLSIPFLELSDSALDKYNVIILLLTIFLIISVFYKALRGGKVDNE